MKALKIPKRIRDNFPKVTTVRDATKSIAIKVTKRDSLSGKKKDHEQCALARACVRSNVADGAIIGIGYSWLIKGKTATRYKTSTGVGREITSFDRHHDFAAGKDYVLSKVAKSNRLGTRNNPIHGPKPSNGTAPHKVVIRHRTTNIRKIKK